MRSDRTANLKEDNLVVFRAVSIGVLLGIITFFILMLLFSFIFLKSKSISYNLITPVALGIGTLGSFFSGYFTAKISCKKGLVYGCISGFILFFIIYIIGAIVFQETAGLKTFLRCIMMVLASSIGGIIGVNKTNHKK